MSQVRKWEGMDGTVRRKKGEEGGGRGRGGNGNGEVMGSGVKQWR